jgi:dTDP-4-dehydrorhamnose reductase
MARFKKILLTGIRGQVGRSLQQPLSALGEVIAVDRQQLDLTDRDAIRRVIREVSPDLIVHPAAYTAVDRAEAEPDLAFAINAVAPGVIAEEASRVGAVLIHYSTDYVYDGHKSAPYVESDKTDPLSVYGKSKLAGEDAIRAVGLPHLIIRTSWVYGPYGKNFMKTIIRLATERDALRIVADQFGAPTSSLSIAEATAVAISRWQDELSGTYHLTNAGRISWHGFAQAILADYEALQTDRGWPVSRVKSEEIGAITTADYPTPATRPTNSCLDGSKLKQAFGIDMPDWRVALERVMHALELESPPV